MTDTWNYFSIKLCLTDIGWPLSVNGNHLLLKRQTSRLWQKIQPGGWLQWLAHQLARGWLAINAIKLSWRGWRKWKCVNINQSVIFSNESSMSINFSWLNVSCNDYSAGWLCYCVCVHYYWSWYKLLWLYSAKLMAEANARSSRRSQKLLLLMALRNTEAKWSDSPQCNANIQPIIQKYVHSLTFNADIVLNDSVDCLCYCILSIIFDHSIIQWLILICLCSVAHFYIILAVQSVNVTYILKYYSV